MLPIIEFLKRFAPMLKSGKMSYADALTRFRAHFGRSPDGLELSSIRKEVEKAPSNIVQFPKDRITPFNKPRPGDPKYVDSVIKDLKSMEPMDAMKEANLVIGRKGKYKNLSIDESQRILKETDDHIFQRDVPMDEPPEFASGGLVDLLKL